MEATTIKGPHPPEAGEIDAEKTAQRFVCKRNEMPVTTKGNPKKERRWNKKEADTPTVTRCYQGQTIRVLASQRESAEMQLTNTRLVATATKSFSIQHSASVNHRRHLCAAGHSPATTSRSRKLRRPRPPSQRKRPGNTSFAAIRN